MGQVTSSGHLRQRDERCRRGAEETGLAEASPGVLPVTDRISTEQDGPKKTAKHRWRVFSEQHVTAVAEELFPTKSSAHPNPHQVDPTDGPTKGGKWKFLIVKTHLRAEKPECCVY